MRAGDEADRTLTRHYLPTMVVKGIVAALVPILVGRVVERRSLDAIGLGGRRLLRHAAAGFGIGHVGGGASPVAVVALSVSAGCIMAASYVVARTLWFPIGLHWAYNLSQGILFDNFGNAGFESPIRTTLIGPEARIGRADSNYGPDTALLAILTVLGVAVGLLALAIRRGRIVAPPWRRGSR